MAPRPRRAAASPPRRARDARRPTVEQRLLAAMESLLEKGHAFGSLSVEQLAAEAGMARATFYLHFRDKGELVLRLMGQLTDEIIASAGVWFENAKDADRRDIERALHGIVGTFRKHRAIVTAINDTAPYDPAVAALYQRMMDRLCAESRRAVATVKKQGKAHADVTPDIGAILTWTVDLYCARFIDRYPGKKIDALVKSLAHICANAIFAPESPSRSVKRVQDSETSTQRRKGEKRS